MDTNDFEAVKNLIQPDFRLDEVLFAKGFRGRDDRSEALMKRTSRREFLKQAGASALVVAAVSPLAKAAPGTPPSAVIPRHRPLELPGVHAYADSQSVSAGGGEVGRNLLEVGTSRRQFSQGRRGASTLGFGAKSLWDSARSDLNLWVTHRFRTAYFSLCTLITKTAELSNP